MKTALRWTGRVLAVLILLLLLAAAYVYFASARVLNRTYQVAPIAAVAPTPVQLADAPRQARIQGCVSCHGEGLQGKLVFEAPGVASVWAPNLTLVAAQATDAQLASAIGQGIGHDGRGLYVMPSAQYSRLRPGEIGALVAFIRNQPRGGAATPKLSFGPLGRMGLVSGGLPAQPAAVERFRAAWPLALGPGHAAGRRLAATVCTECHGPDLSGSEVAGVKTPNLSIAGAYDHDQFRTLLRTGKGVGGRDLGLMTEIAQKDTKFLTDEEIRALYDYLKARAERVPL